MNTTEQWRTVPSVPLLEASTLGRVRSLPYEATVPRGGVKINQMSPTYGVTVHVNNYARRQITFRRKTHKVATLVAEAFHGPRPANHDVAHEDECSLNNIPDNLEYRTRKYNLNMPKIKQYHREVCRDKFARA